MTIAIDSLVALRAISQEECEDAFRPPPRLTPSEWADQNRWLDKSMSGRPGKFRTDEVPYMRRIQDALADEEVREVTFAKSSQVGGSTAGENYLGWVVDQDPSEYLYVWPSEKTLKKWSKTRLEKLIRLTDCLASKMPNSKRREAGNTIFSKEFPGGGLHLLTAKSTNDLRQHSSQRATAEEIDEWEQDVKDQGDPLELLRARLRAFPNHKLYKVSTPTLEGFSRIWSELETSSWEEWHMPCPHCNFEQVLRWRDGNEDLHAGSQLRLLWEKDELGDPIPESVSYVCEACAAFIEERWKREMLDAGKWIARYPQRREHLGFHINSLSSPLCSWADIAKAYKRALSRPGGKKTFVNTWLGFPYAEKGTQVDKHVLSERTYVCEAQVPEGAGLLTAGVDVQETRLELVIRAWGKDERSWVPEWTQIEGDPGQPHVWKELERKLFPAFRHESGALLYVAATAIDAGYQTEHVHRFCDTHKSRNVFAIVGRSGRGKPILKAPSTKVKWKSKGAKRRPSYVVGTDACKDALAGQLRVEHEDQPGYVSFNADIDEVFFDQVTAEKLVPVWRHGRAVYSWQLIPGRRNEALDLMCYSHAALAYLLHVKHAIKISDLAKLAEKYSNHVPGDEPPPPTQRKTRGVRSRGIAT